MNIEEMKQRKKALGLTYGMISKKSGIAELTIKKIFSGETSTPRYETLLALDAAMSDDNWRLTDSEDRRELADIEDKWRLAESEALNYMGKNGSYTIEDYESWPEEFRCELIKGQVYAMGGATVVHNIICTALTSTIKAFIKENKGSCCVGSEGCDFQLNESDNTTIVQPDVFVVCDPDKFGVKRFVGAPDLAIEVLSPGTRNKDLNIKLRLYAQAGVREYWVIDSEHSEITVFSFSENNQIKFYSFGDKIPVGIFDSRLIIDFGEINMEIQDYISKCRQ